MGDESLCLFPREKEDEDDRLSGFLMSGEPPVGLPTVSLNVFAMSTLPFLKTEYRNMFFLS
jgi:hypothetical protein